MQRTSDRCRIAMLIDADNAPASKIDVILAELAKYGVVNIRRAYGNWKSQNLKGWEAVLHEYAIRPFQQFDLTKGKNATDIAMTIDAMDLLYSKELDAFCVVSSDCDFTPLVMRILANGLDVYGFGQQKTPVAFVNACSIFLYLDKLGKQPTGNKASNKSNASSLKSDTKLLSLLRTAVESVQKDDGWSHLAEIGSHIANHASFDPRNYGYKTLGEIFKNIDLFEIDMRNNNSSIYIRERKKKSRQKKKTDTSSS